MNTIDIRPTIHPSLNAITQARTDLRAQIAADQSAGTPHADSTAAVTDPVITVYLNAMKLDGIPPKVTGSGCLEIQLCPTCRKTSAFTFIGSASNATAQPEFRVCAHCDMPQALR